MSQRMGMADGRCITSFAASTILNDKIMSDNNIAFQDNFTYRKRLQSMSPEDLKLPLSDAACRK